MTVEQIISKAVVVFTKVLPALPYPSQLVYVQLFARSHFLGDTACQISRRVLSEVTNLSELTVKRAMDKLITEGLVVEKCAPTKRSAAIYEVIVPQGMRKSLRHQIEPEDVLRRLGAPVAVYEGVLAKLQPYDRQLLEIAIDSLEPVERADFHKRASERVQPGERVDDKFRELVLQAKFGEAILSKYAGS